MCGGIHKEECEWGRGGQGLVERAWGSSDRREREPRRPQVPAVRTWVCKPVHRSESSDASGEQEGQGHRRARETREWHHRHGGAHGRPRAASTGVVGALPQRLPGWGRAQSRGPHVCKSKGLVRLRMGRTQLHCRLLGPRRGLRRHVRKPQASEGAPQASLLPPQPPPLPRSTHTSRACSCRMRPRTTLASSSECPHACAGTCTQEQGSPHSTCSERWHCRSSSESRQPGRPSRPLPRERVGRGQSRGQGRPQTQRHSRGWGAGERTDRGRETQRDTDIQREGKGWSYSPQPSLPDFPDILLCHLHVDDNGVDLILDQLPHAPCAQLQQAVLLLRRPRLYFTPAQRLEPPCLHGAPGAQPPMGAPFPLHKAPSYGLGNKVRPAREGERPGEVSLTPTPDLTLAISGME